MHEIASREWNILKKSPEMVRESRDETKVKENRPQGNSSKGRES